MERNQPALISRAARIRRVLAQATGLEWLLLAVGLGLTWRYFWFMDDAFIYFRYVDNLLFLGRGLVYNPGEYVEAFSSPLWTLLLIPLRATGLDYYVSLRIFALLSCGLFWLTSVWLSRELSPPGPRVSLGTAFGMTHYGVVGYFSSGLETPLVQLSACVFAVLLLRPRSRGWQVLAGLAPLIRPELLLPLSALVVWLWLSERRAPRWLLGSAVGFGAGWLGFRIYYYADLFPNTYYLKDQTELSQGLHYFAYSFGSHHLLGLLLLLVAAALVTWWLRRRAGDAPNPAGRRVQLGMLLCAAAALPYPLKVGGDMVYYRFLAFPICLGLLASAGVLERLLNRAELPRAAKSRLLAFALGLGFAVFSLACYPEALTAHPITLAAKVKHYHGIADSAWHRQLPDLAPNADRARYDAERRAHYRKATPEQLAGERLEVGGWCAADYRKWDRTIIHEWGLTEPVLARATVRADRPGHKYGLKPLARQLLSLRRRAVLPPAGSGKGPGGGVGMYRRAVEGGYAPEWIKQNLPALEIIEKKAYNRHRFFENLSLALERPKVIIPPRQP